MGISEGVYFSPRGPEENSWSSLSPSAVGHGAGRGHRPCESSRPCPERILVLWRQSIGVVMAVEVRGTPRRMR